MLTATVPRSLTPFFRTARATCDSDSTKNVCARRPTGVHAREGCVVWQLFLRPFAEHAAHNGALRWPSVPAPQHIPCQRRDAPVEVSVPAAASQGFAPLLVPEVSRRELVHRWRLSTAGFHSHLRAGCACFLFFPRSVGFGPTASCAKGALTIAPSMLCHAQAIPSISSYSANPFRHKRTNTPLRFHSWKYLWIELALPNRSSGNAFHWHPVRNTYTMPSNILRASRGLRPPPGFRRYLRPFSRFRDGISGSTLAHIFSDTVQDLIAFIAKNNARMPTLCQNIIYG